MPLEKVNLAEKFTLFSEQWQPKIIGDLNDYQIKIARIEGDFVWHQHDDTDEMFLVVKGQFTMRLRDGDILLKEGEMIVIPAGVEHCPSAAEEAQILMFEKAGTLNTGDAADSERTVESPEHI
ncbi:MAG: cupin domain-containing protein [Anaerolineae bacterium]|nr:cupin domain-containing protein [Anaerolineae bacterium]